jgi:hypothetical protein
MSDSSVRISWATDSDANGLFEVWP